MISSAGVLASSLARNSIRALFFTFAVTFGVGMVSQWPIVFWESLASYGDMKFMWSGYVPVGYGASSFIAPPLAAAAFITAIQALAALLFTGWAAKRLKSTWGRA